MLLRFGLEAGRVAARGPVAIGVMAITFVAVGVLRWPMLAVVAVIAPISIVACWPRGGADA
jgi:chromate transporter